MQQLELAANSPAGAGVVGNGSSPYCTVRVCISFTRDRYFYSWNQFKHQMIVAKSWLVEYIFWGTRTPNLVVWIILGYVLG